MPKTVYLTTPLYYVNASPHIGHSYTTIAADALSRYHRLQGRSVFLLTGTDEHGQKIAQAAAKAGKDPQAFTDEVSERFRALWGPLNIRYDDYIRTTQPRHVDAVKQILTRLKESEKLHKESYEGWYCTPDETFWAEAELQHVDGKPACPTCQRPVEFVKEEGWHLPLEAERPWLKQFIEQHPDWIQPSTRYNELKSLLDQPLPKTLCITRPKSRISWGIEVPFDPSLVVYVWIDALFNYITVPGYPSDPQRFKTLWPADVHFIGKDILRHHALYWPILLRALDLSLPQHIVAHGHWKMGEQKMSKSLGNIIDPYVVMNEVLKGQPYASDVYRYFLLREIPFGGDGNFSDDALLKRLGADLANDLGNLVHRTCSMIKRYREGKVAIPPLGVLDVIGPANPRTLADAAEQLRGRVEHAMERIEFSEALAAIMEVVSQANQFIEAAAPWKLAKQPGAAARLDSVLGALAGAIRTIGALLEPFMPSVSPQITQQLGLTRGAAPSWADAAWPQAPLAAQIVEHPVLFPRFDAQQVA